MFVYIALFIAACLMVSPALGQKRIALLIGKQDKIGFAEDNIRIVANGDRRQILGAIDQHAEALKKTGQDAVGFLYYSGHGAANKRNKRNLPDPGRGEAA